MKGEKHLLYPEEVREAAINRTCSRAQCCNCARSAPGVSCAEPFYPDAAHICPSFVHKEVLN